MNTRQEHRSRRLTPLGAIVERPLLFLAFAASVFAGALFVANALMIPSSIESRTRTEIIELDINAATPGGLIRQGRSDPESLRGMIRGLISADGKTIEGMRPVNGLKIDAGNEDGDIVFSMDGGEGPGAIDEIGALVSEIVDRLNRHRAGQREEALAWIKKTGAVWQARIDQAKTAIVNNPFDPDVAGGGGRLEDEKLLEMMIDATVEAQTEGRRDLDVRSDVARLKSALAELEAGHAAQLKHGTALRDAEAGLARHREEAARLTSKDSILNRPAAVIQDMASAPTTELVGHLQSLGWSVVVPVLAALSLVLALLATMAACALSPNAEVMRDSYLNDPHWPLPPAARREFST